MWKIKFVNNKIISEIQSSWMQLPNIPIYSMTYEFPNKKALLFEGFESYICFKEVYKFVLGMKGEIIDVINLLVKYNDEVVQISYNPIKGKILQRKNQWGKEFTPLIWNSELKNWDYGIARSINKKYWKEGLKTNQARIKIITHAN